MSIQQLANIEFDLYSHVISIGGSMESKEKTIANMGIFEEYKRVHKEYAILSENNLEAAKRGLFLQWYSLSEPSCYTGINDLDEKSKEKVIDVINKIIIENKNDTELDWMINYYAGWDYLFESYKIYTAFWCKIENADYKKIPDFNKEDMAKRGQMGIYWNSLSR